MTTSSRSLAARPPLRRTPLDQGEGLKKRHRTSHLLRRGPQRSSQIQMASPRTERFLKLVFGVAWNSVRLIPVTPLSDSTMLGNRNLSFLTKTIRAFTPVCHELYSRASYATARRMVLFGA